MILGAGVRSPADITDAVIDKSKVLSVRGKLTAEAIGTPGREGGDPGLLIRELVGRPTRKRNEPLLIPHFAVPNTRLGRQQVSALRAAGARIVQANEEPQAVARAVAEAPYVITSSLHAMVFADALGVPVHLTTFGDATRTEPRFKYRDYETIFNVESHWQSMDESLEQISQRRPATENALFRQSVIAGKIDSVIAGLYERARPLR